MTTKAEELRIMAQQIKNETHVGANTAERVGTAFEQAANGLAELLQNVGDVDANINEDIANIDYRLDGIIAQANVDTQKNKSATLATGLKIVSGNKYILRATANKSISSNLIGFYVAKSTGGNHAQLIVLSKSSNWDGSEKELVFVARENDENASLTSWFGSETEEGAICNVVLLDADSIDERINQNNEDIANINEDIANINEDIANIDYRLDGIIAQANVDTQKNKSATLATGLKIVSGNKYILRATANKSISSNLIGFYVAKSTGGNHAQLIVLSKSSNWDGSEKELVFVARENDENASLTSWFGSETEEGAICNVVLLNADSIDERIKNVRLIYLSNNVINIAAFDSSATDKDNADYICDGINDEEEINNAINNHGSNITVNLFKGTYYIDSFNEYDGFEKSAIVVKPIGNSYRSVLIKGQRHYYNGTKIVVRESAFSQISADDKVPSAFNVLSTTNQTGNDNQAFWYVSLQDLFISIPNGNNPCIIVNLQNAGCGEEKNLRISAFGTNEFPEYKPSDYNPENISHGIVGIRAFHGWTYGDTVRFDNICVWGCYHGFELGAEHMIVSCCRTRYNYCGWTFGSYYKDLKRGAFDHPITLINCCDEKSLYGPKFEYCGLLNTNDYNIEYDTKLQCVTFIDWNMEVPTYPAEETTPGIFCGTVQFSAGGGTYGNSKRVKFWKEGSGLNFRTINSSHSLGGSSEERKKYIPMYMQQYYDMDLNKLLIYNGENWVDCSGNII